MRNAPTATILERPDYNDEEEEERELPQFMAAGVHSDDGVPSSVEYFD